jgi:microcystin-dependent protein
MALKNGRTTAALQTILIGSVIPPGVIQAFGGGTVPSGWLLCDGSTASRSTYAGLFAAVGVVHGQGNGTTTFHIPDLRGRFLRGADNMGTGAAGRDPDTAGRTAANTGGATGNAVGSVQGAQTLSHTHIQDSHFHHTGIGLIDGTGGPYGAAAGGGNQRYVNMVAGNPVARWNGNTVTPTNQSDGGNETRPQNANASYIIKV